MSLNNISNKTQCDFIDLKYTYLYGNIDLVNSTILPFLLMIIFSSLLIYSIFKSRLRMLTLSNRNDKIKLRKDIQLAVSLVFFNVFYLVLNLPHCIYHLVLNSIYEWHDFVFYLSWFSYCLEFYILFLINSVFRKEFLLFLLLLSCRQKQYELPIFLIHLLTIYLKQNYF